MNELLWSGIAGGALGALLVHLIIRWWRARSVIELYSLLEEFVMPRRIGRFRPIRWLSNKLWLRITIDIALMDEHVRKNFAYLKGSDNGGLYHWEADAIMSRLFKGVTTLEYAFVRLAEIREQFDEQYNSQ